MFRKYGNTTVVYEYTQPAKKKAPSPKQKLKQQKFKEAIDYAKAAMRDPELKKDYQLKAISLQKGNAYNAAIRDFLNKPQIRTAEIFGQLVEIHATDDFKVDRVEVQILADHKIVEEGHAVFLPDGLWRYEIKNPFSDKQGEVIITAFDIPGNSDSEVIKFPPLTL